MGIHFKPGLRVQRLFAGQSTMRLVAAGMMVLTAGVAHAQEKTVTAVMHSGLRMLDPIVSTAHITRDHGYMVYDTLVAFDGDGVVQPQMASWEKSEDNLTYTFKLRDGLLFHDGAKVTAADAVASLERWGARDGAAKFLMAATDSIKATDETTITWKLKEPFPLLLDVLAKQSSVPAFIMPARVAATPADTAITEYVGSGPFEMVESDFQPGVKIVYKRFEDYKPREEAASGMAGGKVVNVDRVEWVSMPDPQTAINAIMTGEIDLIENAQIDLLPVLEASPDVTVEIRDKLGYQGFARMNFKHPPFDNVEIRRAAMTALGQEQVMATMIGNPDYYWLCGAIFGCDTPLGDETGSETLQAGGDKAKAREMLEAAGYDNTPVVIMQPTDIGAMGTVPVVVASELRDAGFNVDLQPMDWQTLVSRRASMNKPSEGGWNIFTSFASGVEANTPLVHPILPSTGDTGWFGWANDPELEALRADYLKATTPEQQKEIAHKIQARVMDNVIFVPLGNYAFVQVRSNKLTDMLPTPVPVFWNIKLAD
ncbi:ABC transporter substrate-binding protein [Tianweitania sediminis]|uniref:ABC transporter substrate-binding protein n=1 Tax=Tianweitania sediminis TaxID=1502156 RepID=A0A8J7UHV7_9HYPH|nr:ABC transporter substrate-binding protein [Tianweitania sediminis]MBP0437054.1 ABC transporter substrate-binding protein [Tianweitania sediminis]